jgi:hypothetical protein
VARADLLVSLVKAAAQGDETLVRQAVSALVAEERGKQHHVLADRLESSMRANGARPRGGPLLSAFAGDVRDLVWERTPKRLLDELVLPAVVRSSVLELVEEQQRGDLLRSYNLEPRHRVLLTGEPGNGKTSLAEAIASELMVPMMVVRYEGIIASFLGETTARLHRLLDSVRTRHCVLFFDEFDAIAKERGDIHETGEIKRVVSSLLLELDGLPPYVTVVVASNHPELLDRAVWRRFQLRLELPPPTPDQIHEWLLALEERLGAPLGPARRKVITVLRDASFADLEEFGLDLQRRQILDDPTLPLDKLVQGRLSHWRARVPDPSLRVNDARRTPTASPPSAARGRGSGSGTRRPK